MEQGLLLIDEIMGLRGETDVRVAKQSSLSGLQPRVYRSSLEQSFQTKQRRPPFHIYDARVLIGHPDRTR